MKVSIIKNKVTNSFVYSNFIITKNKESSYHFDLYIWAKNVVSNKFLKEFHSNTKFKRKREISQFLSNEKTKNCEL